MPKIETTKQYLAHGGEIQRVPMGVSGVTDQEMGMFLRGQKRQACELIAARKAREAKESLS